MCAAIVLRPRSPLDFQLETPGHIPMLLPWLVAAGCSWVSHHLFHLFHLIFPDHRFCGRTLHGTRSQVLTALKERASIAGCERGRDRLHAAFKRSAGSNTLQSLRKTILAVPGTSGFITMVLPMWIKAVLVDARVTQILFQLYIHWLRRHIVCVFNVWNSCIQLQHI